MIASFNIVVAMKPLDGNFAQNAVKHGVAGLNIDGSRVEAGADHAKNCNRSSVKSHWGRNGSSKKAIVASSHGRFPANVMHDGSDAVLAGFPQASKPCGSLKKTNGNGGLYKMGSAGCPGTIYDDSGTAARFFKQVGEFAEGE